MPVIVHGNKSEFFKEGTTWFDVYKTLDKTNEYFLDSKNITTLFENKIGNSDIHLTVQPVSSFNPVSTAAFRNSACSDCKCQANTKRLEKLVKDYETIFQEMSGIVAHRKL